MAETIAVPRALLEGVAKRLYAAGDDQYREQLERLLDRTLDNVADEGWTKWAGHDMGRIKAIKDVRAATGVELRDAKDAVDRAVARARPDAGTGRYETDGESR